jgi:hypothetical protein
VAIVAFAGLALLVLTTLIHYEVLRAQTVGLRVLGIPPRAKLILVIFGTFVAHVIEIVLYGVAIYVLGHQFGAGTLGRSAADFTLANALYVSAENYTSLGYGDILPGGPLRMLAGLEALNGLLLIAWSASFTYIEMERFWKDDDQEKPSNGTAP